MGKLIVIDGLDGTGKQTQVNILCDKLKMNNYNVHKISFPAYESPSSAAVKMYLSGCLGSDPNKLNPYMCSSFYAVDRAIQYIKHHKTLIDQEDSIVISDRYLSANIIHQGAKIQDIENRRKFFKWIYQYETELLGLPKEDITILLEMPVWKSQELMTKRYKGDEDKKDIHEVNIKYLEMCYESSTSAVNILNEFGYNWKKINCLKYNNELKTIEETHKEVYNLVEQVIFKKTS